MIESPCFFLIDDDPDDQEFFGLALEDIGNNIRYVKADDGLHALEILKADKNFLPDFIFLDLNMPRLNGKDCLIEIKKMPHLKDIPVYIYTTSMNENDKIETAKYGAEGFITKPFQFEHLVKILLKVMTTIIILPNL